MTSQNPDMQEGGNNSSADSGVKMRVIDLKTVQAAIPYYQFTYITQMLLKKISQSDPQQQKLFRGVCKLMELNEIELVYWHLINQRSDFGHAFNQKAFGQIKTVAFNSFKDYLQIVDVENVAQYKRQLLFCTLSAYYTIKQLRNEDKIDKLSEFIKEETFSKLYNSIAPAFDDVAKNLSVSAVNQEYQQLCRQDNQVYDDSVNYNQIVDQILDMAPAYQKDEDFQITAKVKRQKKIMHKKQEQVVKAENSNEASKVKSEIQMEEPLQYVQNSQSQFQQRQNSPMFLRSSFCNKNSVESFYNPQSINFQPGSLGIFQLHSSRQNFMVQKKEYK